jgi:hypothetical protein
MCVFISCSVLYILEELWYAMMKIEATISHAKGARFIFAMESNSRFTSWHDIRTGEEKCWRNF